MIIVAGGIGLAPVRPSIYTVLANRDSYGSVSIVYGSRTPDDLLYLDEIREWKSRFDVNVQSHRRPRRSRDGWAMSEW